MIIPDLAELAALRGAVRGLSLHAHRPVMAQLQGAHRSAQRGRGLEFEEVRLYAPGDDTRNIDWRVTARRGRLHTRLYREERERPVWLVVDVHPGLFFGSRRQLKSALLLRTAAMLAWVAAQGGDRVGAVIFDGGEEPLVFPPKSREAGVLPILEALVEIQPRAPGMPASGFQKVVAMLHPLLKPGSMILLLSDFADFPLAAKDLLASAAQHSDCRLIWITDPIEEKGLPGGNHRVGLPGRVWWMNGEAARHSWQDAWRTRERMLKELSMRLNVPLVRLDTHDDEIARMVRLLKEPRWAA